MCARLLKRGASCLSNMCMTILPKDRSWACEPKQSVVEMLMPHHERLARVFARVAAGTSGTLPAAAAMQLGLHSLQLRRPGRRRRRRQRPRRCRCCSSLSCRRCSSFPRHRLRSLRSLRRLRCLRRLLTCRLQQLRFLLCRRRRRRRRPLLRRRRRHPLLRSQCRY